MDKEQENKLFLAYLAHEIKTPLYSIGSILRSQIAQGEFTDKSMDKLKICEKSISQLIKHLERSVEMMQIGIRKYPLKVEAVDFTDFLSDIKNYYEAAVQEKEISFSLDFGGSPYKWLYLDVQRVQQILNNLISNGIKYTDKGGMVKLAVTAEQIEEYRVLLTLEISDNGIGMSEDFAAGQAFVPFSREGQRKEDGNGIGLSVTGQLVEELKGDITLTSARGKGTTVTVRLEADGCDEEYSVKQQADELHKEQVFVRQENSSLKGKKVLVAEDNDIIMEWIIELLEKYEVIFDKAYDGKEAAGLFADSAEGEYDAVFMDLDMPVCDGITAAGIIRGMQREDSVTVPILAFTGSPIENEEDFLAKHRMQGVVLKVSTEQEVISSLERCWRIEEN